MTTTFSILTHVSQPTVFQDLRHTCATLLLSQGVHPKIVSEMLGRANISTPLDTHSHAISGLGDAAASAMDKALENPEDEDRRRGE